MLGLCLYRPNSGADDDDEAFWLIRKVEGDEEAGGCRGAWTRKTEGMEQPTMRAVQVYDLEDLEGQTRIGSGSGARHLGWFGWLSSTLGKACGARRRL